MKIVCGTDVSQHAVQAADVAATLAKRLNGTSALVHVFEATSYASASMKALDELCANGQECLRQEAARLRRIGAKVEKHLLSGSLAIVLAPDYPKQSSARSLRMSWRIASVRCWWRGDEREITRKTERL